ncbi:MAG: hypothetical protein KGY56_12705 [Desulfobacterales bacterium]|nr:hypothetical protein [Desulfobacterales bacterium]
MLSYALKGRKQVLFSVLAPDTSEVRICGDFKRWNGRKHLYEKETRRILGKNADTAARPV